MSKKLWNYIVNEADKHSEYGHTSRMLQISNIKTEMILKPDNIIVSAFRLIMGNDSIVYAFLYTEANIDSITEFTPKYFCANPPFESKDGEYRPKVGRYENLHVMRQTYSDLLDDIDEYITSKKADMGWSYSVSHSYPTKFDNITMTAAYEKFIESIDVGNKLLMIIWYNSIYNIYYGMIEVHTNEKFSRVLGLEGRQLISDTEFFSEIETKYTSDVIRHLRQLQDYFYANPKLEKSFRLGQKLIPLSLIESQRVYSIGYKPWRELLVSSRLGDLVINRICPAFSVISRYMYIMANPSSVLFDNNAQMVKVEISKSAMQITDLLKQASIVSNTTYNALMTNITESLKTFVEDKYYVLNDLIDDTISYNKKEMVLSDVVLAIFSEFMGKTLHNAIESAIRSKLYNSYLGDILGRHETFAKFMFEYVYAFLCSNYHKGIVHADIHLNNLCIHAMYSSSYKNTSSLKGTEPSVVYNLSPEHIFCLPSTQYYGSVIDYSRCLIRLSDIRKYMNSDIEYAMSQKLEHIVGTVDTDLLISYTACRIRYLYKLYFPVFYQKHNVLFEITLQERLSAIFHIITTFDPYMLVVKLRDFITRDTNRTKFPEAAVLSKNVALLNSIAKACEYQLTDEFLRVASDVKIDNKFVKPMEATCEGDIKWQPLASDVPYTEYPNYILLISCFSQFSVTDISDLDSKVIFDYYNFSGSQEYSLDTYETLPPSFKSRKLERIYNLIDEYRQDNLDFMNNVAGEQLSKYF